MSHTPRVSETARVPAPAPAVYALLADYRDGHPRVLPPRYFENLVVDRGGRGAGTEIRFDMRLLGLRLPARGVVSEPEPGRVLAESYPDAGMVTTFTVAPAGVAAADVTIATTLPPDGGLAGALQRALLARLLPRIYREELALIATVATASDDGSKGADTRRGSSP
jgi:hypothetical protein